MLENVLFLTSLGFYKSKSVEIVLGRLLEAYTVLRFRLRLKGVGFYLSFLARGIEGSHELWVTHSQKRIRS